MGTLHFKSKEAYRKYLVAGHIHGYFKKVKGYQKIVIAGKPHRVVHNSPLKLVPISKTHSKTSYGRGIYAGALDRPLRIKMPRI